MKKCIVVLVSFVAIATYAQAPDTLWTKTYGGSEDDYGCSIQQTSDGGYIVAGYTESFGAGEGDAWILRLDPSGDTLGTRIYGDTGWDLAASIQHTTDGGYIVVGTKVFGLADGVWLLKVDDYGDTLWTKKIGFPGTNGGWGGSDVKQTNDNGYVITGGAGGHQWSSTIVMKTDSLGDTLWTNSYGGDHYGNAVLETSGGNYIIVGNHIPWGTAEHEFFLMEVDSLGTMLWYQEYGAPSSAGQDVLVTSDGCLTACGRVSYDIWLIRTDANGDTLWTRRFCDGIARSLDRTFDGGYIMAGETSEDVVFIKTDSLGETRWTAVYGGPEHDSPSSVLQTSDGGYIMVGETNSYGAGNADVWIIKLGPDVGVEENKNIAFNDGNRTTTIFHGPLQLPEGKKCQVFDIMGRVVEADKIQPGIYFIEVDGVVTQKVVKVR